MAGLDLLGRAGMIAIRAARAYHDRAIGGLARRRVIIDRDRHRDRKTKARLGFPRAGPRLPNRNAPAQISVCMPIAA